MKRLAGGQLDRYLLRRLATPVGVSLGMILAALLLDKALRLVQALSDSGARLEFLLPLMATLTPYFLVTAAPFAFFTGLLITVSALDEAGEIEAILAAGVSPGRLAAPFVAAGAAMALAILLVSAGPEPLGRFGYSKGLAQAQQAGWSGRLEPGVVFTPKPGSSLEAEEVLLVGHRLRGVFQTERNALGGETVTTAREGSWSFVHGGRDVALTLRDGSVLRDDGRGGATFGRFDMLDEIEPSGVAASRPVRGGDERELTLPELFGGLGAGGRRGQVVAAELAVKLVQAAVLVFLPLFALPLALASKRGGRAPGMIVAVASLAAFHHAVEFFKGLVVNGRLASAWPIVACLVVFAGLCVAVHISSRRRPGDNPITRTGAWLAWATRGVRRRVALLGGVSWLTRGFSGLPAYVGWLFAVRTGFAGLGFVAFFQIVDLQEMSPKILGRGLGVAGLFHYEALRLPAMMLQLGGLAILVGAVATFFGLGRRSESVAMQACGVSPYRILLATVPVALVVAAIDLGLSSEVAPHAQAALDGWWSASTPAEERVQPQSRWLRVGRDLLHVDHISADGRSLQGVKVYRRDPSGLLQVRTSTDALQWARGWRADATRFDQVGEAGDAVTLAKHGRWTDGGLKPFDLRAVTRTSDETTTLAAAWTRVSGAATDKRGHDLATRVQHGLSEPLSPFIMLLLASPVLVWSGGRRGQTLPMGAALASGLGFLMTDGFLTALGEAGDLPALFAAWTAPAIFAAGGAWALSFSDG
jgi:lipopolysaccharide export system permease protein